MKEWGVYIIRCSDGTLYTGVTTNLQNRLKAHNSGKGAKYTRSRTPVELVYWCGGLSKSNAYKLEWKVKNKSREVKVSYLMRYKDVE